MVIITTVKHHIVSIISVSMLALSSKHHTVLAPAAARMAVSCSC